tara:strand:+ start:3341 stop:4141 length:801 start_codon:yes stop_codon:yes gene_type:complete
MIDFHNHILPGCDDGAKDLEMSLAMLKSAQKQGITDVVNTIHYQHPKMEGKRTDFEYVSSVRDKLQKKLIDNDINISIHLGAEVFFNFNLLDILDNQLTTFCNMKYMLIEFQTFQFPDNYEDQLYNLAISGITPIIAHPERYKPIQKDISIAEKLINSGCLMQMDAGSVLGHFGGNCKNIAERMILSNMIHIIGSDAHNDKKRNFCLSDALKTIHMLTGDDSKDLVNKNPQKVIRGEKIEIPEVKIEFLHKKTIYQRIKKRFFNTK